MSWISTVRQKIGSAIAGAPPTASTIAPLKTRVGAQPYDAGATGRRGLSWVSTRLGSSTLLVGNLDQIRARARDAVRNNPWASSAIDKFESNVIGTGIQPHWQHKDPDVRLQIQAAWTRWIKKADWAGQLDFYGLQALWAREVFEAGEVFIRYVVRPPKDKFFVPLQLKSIEGEQVPVFRNLVPGPGANRGFVRTGIEFDNEGRRIAYHMYKEHPGETMFYPADSLVFIEVPASEIQHVMKPKRVGQLRGEPHLTSVLALLYELDQYSDAELLRKKVSAMFAGFITKPAPGDVVLPPAPNNPNQPGLEDQWNSQDYAGGFSQDIGTRVAKLEPGTMQELFPGEAITFPQVPEASDFASFLSVQLHKFAAGINMTYEQLTGDLKGVTYSSIRAGVLEFRRACEQFQYNVIVHQCCEPIKNRWMKEAVLAGALDLPGYFKNPEQFEDCAWVPPGWQWVDPQKEMDANRDAVRSGFTSRAMVVRGLGADPSIVDAQVADERARAAKLGIVYDSDPNKVLIGRETQPLSPTQPEPTEESEEESGDDENPSDVPKTPAPPAKVLPPQPLKKRKPISPRPQ